MKLSRLLEAPNQMAIEHFLSTYWKGDFFSLPEHEINSDGTVNLKQYVSFEPRTTKRGETDKLTKIPDGIKFNQTESFSIADNALETFEGCPSHVDGDFNCQNNKLKSFEGAPAVIKSDGLFGGNLFESLHDIHKHIKQVDGSLYFVSQYSYMKRSCPIKSAVLGLLQIKGLQTVTLTDTRDKEHELYKVQEIINTFLKTPDKMLECQDALIDAGLEEYAKL
jgi:hypothetical protein